MSTRIGILIISGWSDFIRPANEQAITLLMFDVSCVECAANRVLSSRLIIAIGFIFYYNILFVISVASYSLQQTVLQYVYFYQWLQLMRTINLSIAFSMWGFDTFTGLVWQLTLVWKIMQVCQNGWTLAWAITYIQISRI